MITTEQILKQAKFIIRHEGYDLYILKNLLLKRDIITGLVKGTILNDGGEKCLNTQ